MKRILKNTIHNQFARRNLVIDKSTSRERVDLLIRSLHPYKTDLSLIRLGPEGDGGYLLPDDLQGIEACFSPGVDLISEFELECLNHGMKIFMADKSVEKPNLKISEEKYSFIKKFIGCTNNEDFITMDKWVKSSNLSYDSELLLQMDIEEGEYSSIINMSDSLMSRFRIMVIEFHALEALWQPHFYQIIEAVFNKILQTHICIHIHPNNYCDIDKRYGIEIPSIAEFTFIRKDRIKSKTFQAQFPHKLDFDNTKKKHIALPKNWYTID